MKKIIDFIIRKPWFILSIVIIITGIFGYGLTKLETQNTWESELPKYDPKVVTKERIEEIFGKKDILLIGIETDNVFTHATLTKIKALEEDIKAIKGVIPDEVVSIVSVNNITGSNDGLDVGMFMQNIPQDEKSLHKLKESAIHNEMLVDRIISQDASFTAIVAHIEEGYKEEYIYDEVSALLQKYSGSEHIYMTGDPIQQKEIDYGIKGDLQHLLPLALLILLGIYLFAFRTKTGVILPIIVVVLSIVWTMGFMGLAGYKMTVVSSTIPILMLVISGSYGLHFMAKFYILYAHETDVITPRKLATQLMFRPIMLTGITSAIGLFTLVVFKVKSIQELGIIASVGVLLTFIISIFFISSLLWLLRNKNIRKSPLVHNVVLNTLLVRIGNFSLKNTKAILIFAGIAFLISLYGISQVGIGNDFVGYFPEDHSLRITYDKFNDKLGGARYIDIMFEGIESDAVKQPDFLKEVDDILSFAHTYHFVGNSFSVVDVVKRMNKELHDGNEDFNTIPKSQNEIAQYLFLYSMSGNPGDFNALIDYDYQRTKVRMMLTSSDQEDHKEFYNALMNYAHSHCEHVSIELGGEVMFWLAQVDYIVKGKIQNIILAICVIFLICSLVFRSFKYGFVSIVPLTIASLFTFGIMGFIGLRLETATAIITSIGIGIGIDFAIHYITALRREMRALNDFPAAVQQVMLTSGKSIFLDVLTNMFGFIVFLFSGFIPVQQIGWLISLTMLGACLGSLCMFPAMFKLFKVKF
ncbi:MAG: efflux RND transporter permease subunit [Bacteroidota bacterium]